MHSCCCLSSLLSSTHAAFAGPVEGSSPLTEGPFQRISPTGINSVRCRRDSAVESLTLARQALHNSSSSSQPSPLGRVRYQPLTLSLALFDTGLAPAACSVDRLAAQQTQLTAALRSCGHFSHCMPCGHSSHCMPCA